MQELFGALKKIKVNKGSPHKPLLLLLCLNKIKDGHDNLFVFRDIEAELCFLISKFSGKRTNKINAQYPFVFLAYDQFIWECSLPKDNCRYPDAPSRSEVIFARGKLNSKFFDFIKTNPDNYEKVFQLILDNFFDIELHEKIRVLFQNKTNNQHLNKKDDKI